VGARNEASFHSFEFQLKVKTPATVGGLYNGERKSKSPPLQKPQGGAPVEENGEARAPASESGLYNG
jgi:hypothetical protein